MLHRPDFEPGFQTARSASVAAFQSLKKVPLAEEMYAEYDGILLDRSHGVDVAIVEL